MGDGIKLFLVLLSTHIDPSLSPKGFTISYQLSTAKKKQS